MTETRRGTNRNGHEGIKEGYRVRNPARQIRSAPDRVTRPVPQNSARSKRQFPYPPARLRAAYQPVPRAAAALSRARAPPLTPAGCAIHLS
jgi:hypothetical protein